jgi:cytochrome b involved in lipid metabolism
MEAAMALGLSVATAGTATMMEAKKHKYPQPKEMIPSDTPVVEVAKPPHKNQPSPRPDLPVYTQEEVSEHTDEESLWYTFRGGVYDLTQFYEGHPGGAPVSI